MDKKEMKREDTNQILALLDQDYGTEKDGFYHKEPWQLLIAIMLSAQSTDQQVEAVLPILFSLFPTVEMMAEAEPDKIEEAIKTIGLYHSKAKNSKQCCMQILTKYQGQVPKTMEELTALQGVGRKTANLFLADEYDIPGITVDTHVKRISNRLGWAHSQDAVKVEYELQKVLPKDHWIRINIQLIRHGRAVCKAVKPLCSQCRLAEWCAYGRREI